MEALISVLAGLRTAERRALGVLTAPARLFSPGEPLALMPVSFFADHGPARSRSTTGVLLAGHCVSSRRPLPNRPLERFGIDVDLHLRARFFHVGLIEPRAALA